VLIADRTPPVWEVFGATEVELDYAGAPYTEPGVSVFDGLDGDLSRNGCILVCTTDRAAGQTERCGDAQMLQVGAPLGTVYTLVYSVHDRAGNVANATRRAVIKDLSPPVLTLLGEAELLVPFGVDFARVDPGVLALDNHDGDLSALVSIVGALPPAEEPGTYTVVYAVEDAQGLAATLNRTVIVQPRQTPLDSFQVTMRLAIALGQFKDRVAEFVGAVDAQLQGFTAVFEMVAAPASGRGKRSAGTFVTFGVRNGTTLLWMTASEILAALDVAELERLLQIGVDSAVPTEDHRASSASGGG
jgi:hypothetical protein